MARFSKDRIGEYLISAAIGGLVAVCVTHFASPTLRSRLPAAFDLILPAPDPSEPVAPSEQESLTIDDDGADVPLVAPSPKKRVKRVPVRVAQPTTSEPATQPVAATPLEPEMGPPAPAAEPPPALTPPPLEEEVEVAETEEEEDETLEGYTPPDTSAPAVLRRSMEDFVVHLKRNPQDAAWLRAQKEVEAELKRLSRSSSQIE